jgi:outer membrane cobalamin receptor
MVFKRILCMFVPVFACAGIFNNVRGVVHDPDHRPVAGAHVTLRAAHADWSKTTATNSDGEFDFPAVPTGEYRIAIDRDGFSPVDERVLIVSNSAPVLHYQLKLALARQSVEVSERAEAVNPDSAAPTTFIGRSEIERAPGADRTNSLSMITDFVPGAYLVHDQLHMRGGHQVSWLVDGVPVPNTNIATNVGPQFDPKDIDSLEVLRGGYSAEYGDRTFGVFNVIPRTGFERNNEAELVTSFGNFWQTNDQISLGSHTERFAYYTSLNGNRTDLGLAAPVSKVLHARANGFGGMATLVFNATPADQLRLITSARRDFYQIANDLEQQANGVRDVEHESDAFANFSWLRTAAHGVLLTISPFYHYNRANYVGGPANVPVSPDDDHTSHYGGAQIAAGLVAGKHNARAGIYGFAERDGARLTLRFHDDGLLSHQQSLSGHIEALFLEDQYKPTSWLTLHGGVRLTHFSGTVSENAASPRAGVTIRLPGLNWVLRGSYGRYYQAPPLSTFSGPLPAFARERGFGFLPLHGERDEQYEAGLAIPFRGWLLDVGRFNTRATNFFDHSVLGNSNVFFPLTIDGARIRGWEVSLRSPRLIHRGQVRLAYSRQRAEGFGAVSGGLTDFSPPLEGFLLDHDQRHTLSAGFDVTLPYRAWATGNISYGSGFAIDSGPAHLPGRALLDLSLGRNFGESWSLSVHALNVANRRILLDQSETFGGRHYVDPRQIFAELRYRFHC